jgi:hypothetical protein
MKKLILAGAAFAALGVSVANAADIVVGSIARAPRTVAVNPNPPPVSAPPAASQAPRGVAGARWGSQCWIDTAQNAGYWGPCPHSAVARRPNGRAPVAR